MTCPGCGGDTKVVDSRADLESVRRRRQCLDCGYIFKTTELEDAEPALKSKKTPAPKIEIFCPDLTHYARGAKAVANEWLEKYGDSIEVLHMSYSGSNICIMYKEKDND